MDFNEELRKSKEDFRFSLFLVSSFDTKVYFLYIYIYIYIAIGEANGKSSTSAIK